MKKYIILGLFISTFALSACGNKTETENLQKDIATLQSDNKKTIQTNKDLQEKNDKLQDTLDKTNKKIKALKKETADNGTTPYQQPQTPQEQAPSNQTAEGSDVNKQQAPSSDMPEGYEGTQEDWERAKASGWNADNYKKAIEDDNYTGGPKDPKGNQLMPCQDHAPGSNPDGTPDAWVQGQIDWAKEHGYDDSDYEEDEDE